MEESVEFADIPDALKRVAVLRLADYTIGFLRVPLLSGVAFYQEAVTEAGSGLKCHGRQSVYCVAYDAIAGAIARSAPRRS
jgi:hypothetical protein